MKSRKSQENQKTTVLEKIRPELNLEKWSIWQPSHTKTNKQKRVLQRETIKNGTKFIAKVTVAYNNNFGSLNTTDQRIYYALVRMWEEKGRSTKSVTLNLRELAKVLNISWAGSKTIETLKQSLLRLRGTVFVWEDSFYDNKSKKNLKLLNTFNILSEFKLSQKNKDDKEVKVAVGFYRFHDLLLMNLLANYTKPLLFNILLGFKSEIAQILYTHLDLILADKTYYERRTKELFEDLGLEGEKYKSPSGRKQILEKAFAELEGVELTTGVIGVVRFEKTRDAKDYKAVFQKTASLTEAETADGMDFGEIIGSRAQMSEVRHPKYGSSLKPPLLPKTSEHSGKSRRRAFVPEDKGGRVNKGLFEKLRSGIYREDLFAVYDNLEDMKTIEDLVEEAAYRAVKSIFINNDAFIKETFNTDYIRVDHSGIVEEIKRTFPYDKMPSGADEKRTFFVAAVSNVAVKALLESFI